MIDGCRLNEEPLLEVAIENPVADIVSAEATQAVRVDRLDVKGSPVNLAKAPAWAVPHGVMSGAAALKMNLPPGAISFIGCGDGFRSVLTGRYCCDCR